jgi:prevent-host-death family protein
MQSWQLQEAKARMSELIKQSKLEPQEITLHGKPVAVLVSTAAYQQLTSDGESLVDFMRRSPLFGLDDLKFEREKGVSRDIEL